MYKKLLTTSATDSIGIAPQRRLFRISSGPYLGRMVALVQSSGSELKLLYADPPYSSWSAAYTVASDSDDGAFDAAMDLAGNIQVAYTDGSTGYLVTKRLAFVQGSWNVGAKVTIHNGALGSSPSLGIESGGMIWVAWCRYSAPNRSVQVKSSSDSGANWGTGPADAGQQLTSGNPFECARLLVAPNHIHVIATYGGNRIVIRSLPSAGGSWSDEFTIASGASGFTDAFDAAVRSDGLVGLVYNDSQFRYREFDGVNWGGVVTLYSAPVESPQVFFRGQVPVVAFLVSWSGLQRVLKVTDRSSGVFSNPIPLEIRAKSFDSVLLFNAGAGSYQEVTGAAGNVTTGDVFHSASNAMLKNVGDQLYLGMNDRFRFADFVLTTAGVGGSLSFSYWDGSNWHGVTPSGGASYLDQVDSKLLLWDDFASIPTDWQKKSIAGSSRFWVKLEVQSAYTTGPVGSHVTAISELQRVIFRR